MATQSLMIWPVYRGPRIQTFAKTTCSFVPENGNKYKEGGEEKKKNKSEKIIFKVFTNSKGNSSLGVSYQNHLTLV